MVKAIRQGRKTRKKKRAKNMKGGGKIRLGRPGTKNSGTKIRR